MLQCSKIDPCCSKVIQYVLGTQHLKTANTYCFGTNTIDCKSSYHNNYKNFPCNALPLGSPLPKKVLEAFLFNKGPCFEPVITPCDKVA